MLGVTLSDAPKADPLFPVDPANWDAVTLFCQCHTQWRYGVMGGLLGLDYAGVRVVMAMTIKRSRQAAIFESLQVMEQAAMITVNARLKK